MENSKRYALACSFGLGFHRIGLRNCVFKAFERDYHSTLRISTLRMLSSQNSIEMTKRSLGKLGAREISAKTFYWFWNSERKLPGWPMAIGGVGRWLAGKGGLVSVGVEKKKFLSSGLDTSESSLAAGECGLHKHSNLDSPNKPKALFRATNSPKGPFLDHHKAECPKSVKSFCRIEFRQKLSEGPFFISIEFWELSILRVEVLRV